MEKLELISRILMLNDEDKTTMYDLAGKKRNSVAPDLPDYIMEHDYVSAALRTARDLDASEADCGKAHYQIIGLRDIDPEAIRRELAVSGEDGIRVIARHMNYGLYRVEGKSDCPRDALNICRMLSLKPEILRLIEENY